MKKRIILIVMILAFIAAIAPVVFAQSNDAVSVTIDGEVISFTGQQPTIVDGRTLVPVRGVFEALGFDVGWDGAARTATLVRSGYIVIITIESDVFTTNGNSYALDVPAQIIGGSTMLPIRAVLESVGYYVSWDPAARAVVIRSGGVAANVNVAGHTIRLYYASNAELINLTYIEHTVYGDNLIAEIIRLAQASDRVFLPPIRETWREGSRLYVDMPPEAINSFQGSSGAAVSTVTLLMTLGSLADVDEIVLLLDGIRDEWGDHFNFSGVFKITGADTQNVWGFNGTEGMIRQVE